MLANDLVTLEPADAHNVDLLVRWTLDPVAQGPTKRVPAWTVAALQDLFLHSPDRHYYLIRRGTDGKPLGRFYHRAWLFGSDPQVIDWELNIFIAHPGERGKGYGTAVQKLALDHLLPLPETHSVFAYTHVDNVAEQRALEKAGFEKIGRLPHADYPVRLPAHDSVLYALGIGPGRTREKGRGPTARSTS